MEEKKETCEKSENIMKKAGWSVGFGQIWKTIKKRRRKYEVEKRKYLSVIDLENYILFNVLGQIYDTSLKDYLFAPIFSVHLQAQHRRKSLFHTPKKKNCGKKFWCWKKTMRNHYLLLKNKINYNSFHCLQQIK